MLAQSQATNTQQGDVKSVSNATYMAVNGSGFFVVEPAIGQSDGTAVFGGANYYTRRGDFDVDKNGYLVNGSGYYLKGLPIDTATGQHLELAAAGDPASRTRSCRPRRRRASTISSTCRSCPRPAHYQESKTDRQRTAAAAGFR